MPSLSGFQRQKGAALLRGLLKFLLVAVLAVSWPNVGVARPFTATFQQTAALGPASRNPGGRLSLELCGLLALRLETPLKTKRAENKAPAYNVGQEFG